MPFPRKNEAFFTRVVFKVPVEVATDETELEIAVERWAELEEVREGLAQPGQR